MIFKLAKIFTFISGVIPFSVGCYYYTQNILHRQFNLTEHIAFTNLIATGATVCVLTYFEYDNKKTWVVLFLLFILMWVGGNDTYAITRSYYQGSGIFPVSIFQNFAGIMGFVFFSWDLLNE